jgi:hypothetical protein
MGEQTERVRRMGAEKNVWTKRQEVAGAFTKCGITVKELSRETQHTWER